MLFTCSEVRDPIHLCNLQGFIAVRLMQRLVSILWMVSLWTSSLISNILAFRHLNILAILRGSNLEASNLDVLSNQTLFGY